MLISQASVSGLDWSQLNYPVHSWLTIPHISESVNDIIISVCLGSFHFYSFTRSGTVFSFFWPLRRSAPEITIRDSNNQKRRMSISVALENSLSNILGPRTSFVCGGKSKAPRFAISIW